MPDAAGMAGRLDPPLPGGAPLQIPCYIGAAPAAPFLRALPLEAPGGTLPWPRRWIPRSARRHLAGPGIGNYQDVEKILPAAYASLLTLKETQIALTALKRYIKDNLCKELNLIRGVVPLIVDVESGVNDYLDRDGSRTPSGSISPTITVRTLSTPRASANLPNPVYPLVVVDQSDSSTSLSSLVLGCSASLPL